MKRRRTRELQRRRKLTAPQTPIGGSVSVMPASTSATCRTRTECPSRDSRPAMFSKQPRSPANSVSAPVATISAALSETIRVEMSGYLTQNVPPKPQHTSGSAISRSSSPGMLASSARGCALIPNSRRPEQLS